MPTPTKGPRLGGGPAHERLMLANLATALFEHGKITTTEAKAKRLRPLAERLITFAKRGDLHARRRVMTVVRDKGVVHVLFTEIGPRYENRQGGYTRITKVGPRKGDNAPMAVIELVEALTVAADRGRRGRGGHQADGQEGPGEEGRREGRGRRPRPTRTEAATDAAEAPYGEGSSATQADGFDIKGNADSMKYHAPEQPVLRPHRRRGLVRHDRRRREGRLRADRVGHRPPVRRGLARPAGRPGDRAGRLRHQGQRGLDEVPHAGEPLLRPHGRRGLVRHRRGGRGGRLRGHRGRRGRRHGGRVLTDSTRPANVTEPVVPSRGTAGSSVCGWTSRYDGTDFSGWAVQPGLRTVQGEVEDALGHGAAAAARRGHGAPAAPTPGCTPAARSAHVDVPAAGARRRRRGAPRAAARRACCPTDIGVRAVGAGAAGLRRPVLGAVAALRLPRRRPRRAVVDPLRRHEVLRHRAAAGRRARCTRPPQALLGEHDFAAFCRRREGASTVRTLLELRWARDDDGLVVATVRADAFCHSMVRALVGSLLPVGEGRRPVGWPAEVLLARRARRRR